MAKFFPKMAFGILMLLFFMSCQKEAHKSEEIQFDGNILHHSELGWKMEIPEGWINISKEELEKERERLERQFSHVSTDLKLYDSFGITLKKNIYNTFNSIYFLNENNSYTKIDFQKEKIEKYRILNDYNLNYTIDSTITKSLKVGDKQFDYYTILMEFKDGQTLKSTIFTGKVSSNYQLIVTIKTEDIVSESEILHSFYNSIFD